MEKRTAQRGILAASAVLLLCTGAVLALRQPQQSGLAWEENAMVGFMPGVDLETRRKQLQQELDESQIAFSLNSSPAFVLENGIPTGKLMLENPGNNHKLLTAELQLSATGETLYQSGALRPGSYLEEVALNRTLPAGEYPITVYLRAYREDTEELIGQTGASVTLTVLPG